MEPKPDGANAQIDEPVATDEPREVAPDRLATWFDAEVRTRPGGFALDVASLTTIAWLLWWLADNDGGLRNTESWLLSTLVLVASPFLAAEWRRSPRVVRILTAALPIGVLVSFAFALDRSQFAPEALSWGMVAPVTLMAARLMRRRWTMTTLLATLGLASLAWSWAAGLKWWAWIDNGGQPRWELLSWRNQSGALSAAFGVWGLGMLLRPTRRRVAVLAAVAAAFGLAGAWLSSSRAAVLAAVLGVVVVGALHLLLDGGRGERVRTLRRLAAGVAVAAVVVVGLQATIDPAATTPLASRDEAVTTNTIARLHHWDAAAGIFLDRPLTGGGLGSYRALMTSHNPAEGNLTSSAHSELLEAFAEGGLVFGLPVAGLMALAAFGVLWLPHRRRIAVASDAVAAVRSDLGLGLQVGAAGVLATSLSHAAIDFDFRYLSLLGIAVVAGGVLLAAWSRPDDATAEGRPASTGAIAAMVASTLVLSLGLGLFQRTAERDAAPWETLARSGMAMDLVARGDLEGAQAIADTLARWNPGDPVVQLTQARVEYAAGALTADELVDRLPAPPTTLSQWARTAEALLAGGDLQQADAVAAATTRFHPEYQVWGIDTTVASAWLVRMEVAAQRDGCDRAATLLAEAGNQGFDRHDRWMPQLAQWLSQRCPTG